MPGSLDGHLPDVQKSSQPIHKEGQGSRIPIVPTHQDTWNGPRVSVSCSDSLCSSCRAVWKRARLGPIGDLPTRESSTPPQLVS